MSILIGVICFVALEIMSIPYAPLLAVLLGVTNLIPFFGPFLGAIPSCILIFLAVSCHQQKQQYNQKILCIEILRQQLFQKTADTGNLFPAGLPGWYGPSGRSIMHTVAAGRRKSFFGWCRLGRRWRKRLFRTLHNFLHTVSLVSTVRLGNVTVIQWNHLPESI